MEHHFPDDLSQSSAPRPRSIRLTPEQVAAHMRHYEEVGIVQVIFAQQSEWNRHNHICESLEVFGRDVLPEFRDLDRIRKEKKQRELVGAFRAALARETRMAPINSVAIPEVTAMGCASRRPAAPSARTRLRPRGRGPDPVRGSTERARHSIHRNVATT